MGEEEYLKKNGLWHTHYKVVIRLNKVLLSKNRQLRRKQNCILCGNKAEVMHHPINRKEYDSYEDYVYECFLTPLCEECHSKAHAGKLIDSIDENEPNNENESSNEIDYSPLNIHDWM